VIVANMVGVRAPLLLSGRTENARTCKILAIRARLLFPNARITPFHRSDGYKRYSGKGVGV
jgi:hypothetical protein